MKTIKHLEINGITIPTRYLPSLPYNELLKERARKLRRNSTLSEVLFWMQVNKGKFHGIDFDRQRIIGNYIADFYVECLGLVIEIDGGIHRLQEDKDEIRSLYLESLGIIVYRISEEYVRLYMETVLINLEDFIIKRFGMQ
jgi:very-short-patch-repair endonuclease